MDEGNHPSIGSTTSWRSRLAEIARDNAWQCVTGFLVVVFAIERLATSVFYGQFGVTLEEVGIGYEESLLEGVVLFLLLWVAVNVFILAPSIAAILYGWAHFSAFARGFWDAAKESPRAMLAYTAHRLSAVAMIIVVIVFRNDLDSKLLGAAIGGALVLLVVLGIHLRGPKARAPAAWAVILRRSLIVTSITAVLLLVTFLAAPFFWAMRDSRAAAMGLEVAGFPAISWRALPVTVHWLQPESAPAIVSALGGHCVVYLGQSNGITVLFDVQDQRTLRLPTSGIVLQTHARSTPAGPCAAR
jgi:hypothetical protein